MRLLAVITVWGVVVVGGVAWLWQYKNTPGENADAPREWPVESSLARDSEFPTLIMLAHPKCPCTRASMEELSVVMSRFQGRVRAYVLFVRPDGTGPDWEDSDTLRRAREISGVTVVVDRGGREAARFGASVSGQTLLYDRRGALSFEGGITGARGHVGDNVGRTLLVQRLAAHATTTAEAAVFGCELGRERP